MLLLPNGSSFDLGRRKNRERKFNKREREKRRSHLYNGSFFAKTDSLREKILLRLSVLLFLPPLYK
jgi:hypothetical protein